ncbi:unnamed protein product [Malus baccata var. baccata]
MEPHWYSIWLILVGMRFTSIWRSMLMLVVLMIWRSATRLCNFVPSLAVMIRPLSVECNYWVKVVYFEGHDTPVHSVCPHNKQNVHFFVSTSVNGKIKAWLYNNMGYQVDYDASDHSITTMAYGADGKRLVNHSFQMLLRPTPIFQATRKDGESHVVEWNENDGVIKRNYVGFQKPSSGVVQFDTSKNKYLSVGDDYAIKVWDMEKVNILIAVDAEGGLPLPET